MVEMLNLRRSAGGVFALAAPLVLASASAASASQFAQTPSFEGSYLALIGVIGMFLLVGWLVIRISFRVENRDRSRGRPDLAPGGFLGDVDGDDDDHVHIPH